MMVWRATRCLRPRDRLASPASVVSEHLIMKANETSRSCYYSLLVEAESDGMKSCKVSKTL